MTATAAATAAAMHRADLHSGRRDAVRRAPGARQRVRRRRAREPRRRPSSDGLRHRRRRAHAAGRADRPAGMSQPIPTMSPSSGRMRCSLRSAPRAPRFPIEVYDDGMPHVCVHARERRGGRGAPAGRRRARGLGRLCISCFALRATRSGRECSRPVLGVGEDPATGSAGPIALHLARHGVTGFDRSWRSPRASRSAGPRSCSRGCRGDADRVTRVAVAGSAVQVGGSSYLLETTAS